MRKASKRDADEVQRARRTYDRHDRKLSNPESRRRLSARPPRLDAVQSDVVERLRTEGIAVLPFEALLPDPDLWSALARDAAAFSTRTETQILEERIAESRGQDGKGRKREGKKDFLRRAYRHSALELDNPWLRVSVCPRVLDVVNSYLELWSKLTGVDLWYTVPRASGGERVDSQRWHRDYADQHLLKLFIYMSHVDEGTGAFQYVAGSARSGPYSHLWPWRVLDNPRPPQEELEREVPASAVRTVTGPPGTVILCNTSGFHRGGYATAGPRVMSAYRYVSPAGLEALCARDFQIDPSGLPQGLTEEARFALV